LIYELKKQVSSTQQGGMSVTEYYNQMNGFWLEIDHNRDLKLECSHDIQVVQGLLENDRVFEFLAGLNSEYDQIRVPLRIQILGKILIPTLRECFSIVHAEESRQGVMLEPCIQEATAMDTCRPGEGGNKGNWRPTQARKQSNKDGLWCTHCNKSHHTRENYFKLHGKAQVLARIGGFKSRKR